MKKMTYTLIVARLTMLSAGKSVYAQIFEAKNVPQDTVMYKTTYEVRQIIPPLYEVAGFFREGRARIKRDNKWGVLSAFIGLLDGAFGIKDRMRKKGR